MKRLPLSPAILKKYRIWKSDNAKHPYRPYLTVRSFNSIGTAGMISSVKTGRVHHLMSQQELHAFVILESLPAVIDICEQWALDPNRTFTLAVENNLHHPGSRKAQSLTPVTTDFMVRIRVGDQDGWVAMAYKPTNLLALKHPTSRQRCFCHHLELERLYWPEFHVPWRLLTRADIDRIEVYNLEFLRPRRILPTSLRPYLERFFQQFTQVWQHHRAATLRELITEASRNLRLTFIDGMELFRWVAWGRQLPIDLHQFVELYLPLPRLPL